MPNLSLNVSYSMAACPLVPSAIQIFGATAELNDEIARQVWPLKLSALFLPKP
jgi:hypothetical protein